MRHIAITLIVVILYFALAPLGQVAAAEASSGGAAEEGDFTSTIVKKFETGAQKWEQTFKEKALKVFWALAAIALFIKFAPIVLGGSSDFGTFARELTMFVLTTMVLYYCVANSPELFRSLVDFFSQSAVKASGGDVSPHRIFAAALNAFALTAQGINKGFQDFLIHLQSIANTNDSILAVGDLIKDLLRQICVEAVAFTLGCFGLLAIAVAVVFAGAIAIKYAIVLCASYIVAYAGIIILGFSGWGFTRDVIISYFKAAAGLGIQLMCYILLVNLGLPLIEGFATSFSYDPHAFRIQDFITFLTTMVMWYLLVSSVPPMVSQICGAPSLQTPGVGAIAGGALALGGAAAGVVADSAKSGGAAAKAAYAAAKADKQGTGKALANAIGSGIKGAASGASHNSGNAITAALKTAAQGGSFGSVMASAMGNSSGHSASIQQAQKEAQQEQKQAQRDETQASIAKDLSTLTAALNPTSAAAGDDLKKPDNGGSGSGDNNNGGGAPDQNPDSASKGLDGSLTGQQPGGNASNINADATKGQAPAKQSLVARVKEKLFPGRKKDDAKGQGNAPKRSGNAQKPPTSQAAKETVYGPNEVSDKQQ